jgi:hypothetical protein
MYSSSWKKTSQRVVEEGTPTESFPPPPQNALLGVKGSALRGIGHIGNAHELQDEESASNDEDTAGG